MGDCLGTPRAVDIFFFSLIFNNYYILVDTSVWHWIDFIKYFWNCTLNSVKIRHQRDKPYWASHTSIYTYIRNALSPNRYFLQTWLIITVDTHFNSSAPGELEGKNLYWLWFFSCFKWENVWITDWLRGGFKILIIR